MARKKYLVLWEEHKALTKENEELKKQLAEEKEKTVKAETQYKFIRSKLVELERRK